MTCVRLVGVELSMSEDSYKLWEHVQHCPCWKSCDGATPVMGSFPTKGRKCMETCKQAEV